MNYGGLFYRGRIVAILSAAVFFCFGGGAAAYAADVNLDQNEEIQWVMGDLSALKTAAQTYYSDSKSKNVPALSDLLAYFDDQSLPPNAKTLYAIRGNSTGWYVGYNSGGLKANTYTLLQENANTLGLVGDDLSTPWRKGNTFIWSSALALSASAGSGSGGVATNNYTTNNYTTNNYTTDNGSSGSTTVVQNDNSAINTAIGVAAVAVGTAALLDIIDDHDSNNYYYNYPGTPWYWHSAIVYRPVYYDRFFDHYYRPLPLPPRPYPRPVYRYNVPHAGYIAPSYRQAIDRAHYNYDPNHNRTVLDRRNVDQRVAAQKRVDNRKTVNINKNTINVNNNRGIQKGEGHLQPRQAPQLKNNVQRKAPDRENIQRPQQRQAPQRRPQPQEDRPRLQNRESERPQVRHERSERERPQHERPQIERRDGGGLRRR